MQRLIGKVRFNRGHHLDKPSTGLNPEAQTLNGCREERLSSAAVSKMGALETAAVYLDD